MKKRVIINIILVVFVLPIVLELSAIFGVVSSSPNQMLFEFLIKRETENYDYVEFLDVGQGDSTLINSNGEVAVIDFGVVEDGDKIYKTLARKNIKEISFAVITHHHSDHMGGFLRLAKKIKINTLLINNSSAADADKELYNEVIAVAKQQKINLILPKEGSRFKIGNACLTLLKCNTSAEDENNRSIISLLEIYSKSFLFTGDCESGEELSLIQSYNIKVDVLKLGHHGSKNASSEQLLNSIKPQIAVASCGYDNTYNHPSSDTLLRLKNRGIRVYRTDLNQNILFGFKRSETNQKITSFVKLGA